MRGYSRYKWQRRTKRGETLAQPGWVGCSGWASSVPKSIGCYAASRVDYPRLCLRRARKLSPVAGIPGLVEVQPGSGAGMYASHLGCLPRRGVGVTPRAQAGRARSPLIV